MDIDDFQLAFELLFCGGDPLDEEVAVELMAAVNTLGWRADVTESDWNRFHAQWVEDTKAPAYLEAILERKKVDSAAANERKRREALQKKLDHVKAAQAQAVEQPAAAKPPGTKLAGDQPMADKKGKPTLLASYAAKKGALSAEAAVRHRALDLAAWSRVVDDVGGLDEVLESIRRRIWVPLCAPRYLLAELGGEPVKGLLLHGQPGCGKSYLAARLAEGLSRRPPTIVSGPEVMDRYIGSSEAALRALFVQPPPVPAQSTCSGEVEMNAAEENELHIIVLDEFDAIARSRSGKGGSSEGATAARDSVVNQLLALMDGVASLPVPTFVIALTNRRELIDPAVLRPGRLEVQVEVGRPDAAGRAAILRIHAEKMRASGRLTLRTPRCYADHDGRTLEPPDEAAYSLWLANIASRTSGFSGAALAALVRGAIARALDRSVEALDANSCSVTEGDFELAIEDLRATSLELEQFLTDDRGRRDVANAAVGKEYVLTGKQEAECEQVSNTLSEKTPLANEEPAKPSPDVLTMRSLSEQLAMALQRIEALEDERAAGCR